MSIAAAPEQPLDLRLELAKCQDRITEYHAEKLELCERMDRQMEKIHSLIATNERFSKIFERLGIGSFDSSPHNLADIKSLEDKINDLIAENSENTLELNQVKKENMRLKTAVDQLNKTLQLTNRELERTDKEYRRVAKELRELEAKRL